MTDQHQLVIAIRKVDNNTLNLYTLPVIELKSLGVTLRPSSAARPLG